MACKQVEAGAHESSILLAGSGNTFLYQAYVGRVTLTTGDTVSVYIDDNAIQTGTTGTLTNAARTVYDGISYARVDKGSTVDVADRAGVATNACLSQNYPNPFNLVTRIVFTLPLASPVTLEVFDVLGRNVATSVEGVRHAGTHIVEFDGAPLSSGTYFYRLTTRNGVEIKRMLLLK
jgi:hypothetical protein